VYRNEVKKLGILIVSFEKISTQLLSIFCFLIIVFANAYDPVVHKFPAFIIIKCFVCALRLSGVSSFPDILISDASFLSVLILHLF
jgi:hypothetical protein